jgi:hypothetical protein
MKTYKAMGEIFCVVFDEGCAVLVGNRTWPTKKDHFVYFYFDAA